MKSQIKHSSSSLLKFSFACAAFIVCSLRCVTKVCSIKIVSRHQLTKQTKRFCQKCWVICCTRCYLIIQVAFDSMSCGSSGLTDGLTTKNWAGVRTPSSFGLPIKFNGRELTLQLYETFCVTKTLALLVFR